MTFLSEMLGYPHHIPSHYNGKLVMRAFFIYIQLDISKINHMQTNGAGIFRDYTGKVDHLLLSPFTGIGRSMKIHCVEHHSALCHQVTRNRAVYTT